MYNKISGDSMDNIGSVLIAMISYYTGDVRRINHFLKVYGFAKAIGIAENLSTEQQDILEITALTHDIGIKNSELKYHSAAGPYQEKEGPPEAKALLETLGFDTAVVNRVCWLIAHHHTYSDIVELDHQILVEADFIVNAHEDTLPEPAIANTKNKIFRTETGKKYLEALYDLI